MKFSPILIVWTTIIIIPELGFGIRGDLDRDGDVDFDDFFIFSDNFGNQGPAQLSDCEALGYSEDEEISEAASVFSTGGDITGATATNRSGDCTNYVNDYSSNVTYLQNNQTFTGDVSISVSGGKCVFSSNGIPNHDMGAVSYTHLTLPPICSV